jgi:hypothetical protein
MSERERRRLKRMAS